ncbi:MAG: hypothetical protein M1836_002239 [Candelina mexicana]|nr:MAG: hypothetical protein M1836_002239 [Candelina mexicana]
MELAGSANPFLAVSDASPPQRGEHGLKYRFAGRRYLLSEEDIHDGKTGEAHMLEASRAEIENKLPENLHGVRKVLKEITIFVDSYIVEPIATGLRFLHLVIIFVPVMFTVPVIWVGSRVKERDSERSGTLWWYQFLVSSMERAGPAFIKLGQWAASRTDIFPTEMCSVMSSLHSHAPAHSLAVTKRTIVKAFGNIPFDEIFEEFDEKPLGVGAIAQVYKAKLKANLAAPGDPDLNKTRTPLQNMRKNVDALVKSTPQRVPSSYVAIKVLHPKVEKFVRRDLRIMGFFGAVLNAIPTIEWLSLPDEVQQFGEMMRLQLDLRIESANLTMFRKHFKSRTTAWFPYPYTEYTTRQVLVEEFAQGIPLEDFLEAGGGVFQQEIADEGLDAFLHMLLIDNFIHADLHPGNIMVRFYRPERLDVAARLPRWSRPKENPEKALDVTEEVLQQLRPHRHKPEEWVAALDKIEQEGYRPQLIFIDTGLVTELNQTNRTNFLDLFKAIAEFDGYKAGHLMVERCRQPDAVINQEVFALKMQHLVLGVKSRTFALGNIKIGDVLSGVLSMVREHHVRMEGDFVNVVISILLLEGIGRSLDPNLDLFKSALPILRQLGAQSGGSMLRSGDISMLKVWVGLELRKYLQASIDDTYAFKEYHTPMSPAIFQISNSGPSARRARRRQRRRSRNVPFSIWDDRSSVEECHGLCHNTSVVKSSPIATSKQATKLANRFAPLLSPSIDGNDENENFLFSPPQSAFTFTTTLKRSHASTLANPSLSSAIPSASSKRSPIKGFSRSMTPSPKLPPTDSIPHIQPTDRQPPLKEVIIPVYLPPIQFSPIDLQPLQLPPPAINEEKPLDTAVPQTLPGPIPVTPPLSPQQTILAPETGNTPTPALQQNSQQTPSPTVVETRPLTLNDLPLPKEASDGGWAALEAEAEARNPKDRLRRSRFFPLGVPVANITVHEENSDALDLKEDETEKQSINRNLANGFLVVMDMESQDKSYAGRILPGRSLSSVGGEGDGPLFVGPISPSGQGKRGEDGARSGLWGSREGIEEWIFGVDVDEEMAGGVLEKEGGMGDEGYESLSSACMSPEADWIGAEEGFWLSDTTLG